MLIQDERIAGAKRALGAQVGENKILVSGASYEEARSIWNAAVIHRPCFIVLCEGVADVQAAVRVAALFKLSLSVRGGGHDWAGRSLRGELVLDLRRMCEVSIQNEIATVGGGALSTQLAEVSSSRGLTAVTGIIGSVGVAGLTLGGGYGHLTARFGLALDNMVGAEIVLADGRVVVTDAQQEPDLFWALRGGGGNFGVATKLHLKVHPIPDLSDGIVAFSWDQAQDVIRKYNKFVAGVSDDLTLMPTFFAAPDGELSIVLHHAWCGACSEDERILEAVKQLGVPHLVRVARKSLAGVLKEAERRTIRGVHWIVRTVTLDSLQPEAVAVIQTAMEQRSSPLSWIASHPFYGWGIQVPVGSTAFGIRTRHFMVGIYTAWESGDDTPHRKWADAVEDALRPFALANAYPNYFGVDRPDQAASAYGANAERLLRVKEAYDPTNVFSATSLPSTVPA